MENNSETLTTTSETYLNRLPNRHSPVDISQESFLNIVPNSTSSLKRKSTVFRSLVALVKAEYPFDNALQDRAVQFLKSLTPIGFRNDSTAKLVTDLVSSSAGSPSGFVESIVTLLSSPHSTVVEAALSFLHNALFHSSFAVRCRLMESGLISKVLVIIGPHTLPVAGNETMFNRQVDIISFLANLALPRSLEELGIIASMDKFNHREMIFQKVVIPSYQFVSFLISNRHILNGDLFRYLMCLLEKLLEICPYHRPTLEFILASPIVMGFSSCLSFVEDGYFLYETLVNINNSLGIWKKDSAEMAQSGKRMMQALISEGFEDTLEQTLMNDKDGDFGLRLVTFGVSISQQLGSNVGMR
ncbi:hypothetical protein BLNAU_21623 [Blattamonas nauphoetae]|uniref:Uncharacterized protein n=1 Tax=Blattamonas nauphoetae TaxID=2049346 RepID=A0ABQ9WVC6_9EUKA|nr:hypothetical protein BLNAU_21623 [Blattamonas nauphoetae]